MCMIINLSKLSPCSPFYIKLRNKQPSKQINPRHRKLNNRRIRMLKKKAAGGALKTTREMELKNLKLYMENKSIIEENEKLRRKALLLHQENQALLSQLQTNFLIPAAIT